MKQGIHPDYHKITVAMTDGTRYDTYSTWGKEGDVLTLDVDPKTHPAWVGGVNLRKTGQLEKFENKFKHFATASTSKKPAGEAAISAKPASAKTESKKDDKKDDKKS